MMLKILQARLQHYVNQEIPDVQAGFRKAEEPDIKLPTLVVSQRKHGNSRRTFTSTSLTMPKRLTVWIKTNCRKFLKTGILDHLNCHLRSLYVSQEATVRTRHGQQISSNLEKECIKAVYCHPAYLTYM